MKQKKIPQRQCVGCRTMHDKRDLIRVVKSPEGVISLDSRGKMPGRGAYAAVYDALEAQMKAEAEHE